MKKTSQYAEHKGHHQIWVHDGHGLPLKPEILEWLRASGHWIGACGISGPDGPGTFYNFSDKETAMLFKLTWG